MLQKNTVYRVVREHGVFNRHDVFKVTQIHEGPLYNVKIGKKQLRKIAIEENRVTKVLLDLVPAECAA